MNTSPRGLGLIDPESYSYLRKEASIFNNIQGLLSKVDLSGIKNAKSKLSGLLSKIDLSGVKNAKTKLDGLLSEVNQKGRIKARFKLAKRWPKKHPVQASILGLSGLGMAGNTLAALLHDIGEDEETADTQY